MRIIQEHRASENTIWYRVRHRVRQASRALEANPGQGREDGGASAARVQGLRGGNVNRSTVPRSRPTRRLVQPRAQLRKWRQDFLGRRGSWFVEHRGKDCVVTSSNPRRRREVGKRPSHISPGGYSLNIGSSTIVLGRKTTRDQWCNVVFALRFVVREPQWTMTRR